MYLFARGLRLVSTVEDQSKAIDPIFGCSSCFDVIMQALHCNAVCATAAQPPRR